jgi:hypothetical protein
MSIFIVLFVLIFVTLAVAGFRAIDTLDKVKRETKPKTGAKYVGPRYNAHGRQID